MNKNKQQAEIAEACGYIGLTLPDYLNDLNAMHEAEKVLWSEHSTYIQNLERSIGQVGTYSKVTATAAQRAEAFLRTLNLWED